MTWRGKAIPLVLSFLCFIGPCFAREGVVESWPEEVDALVIYDEHDFQVSNYRQATYKVYRKVQVNTERGKELGSVLISENKYMQCKKVEGRVRDLEGNILRKLDKDDIFTTTRTPGYVLYDDAKYQVFELTWNQFPYIVEYSYQIDFKSLLFWPGWYPQQDVPVMKSIYRLTMKSDVSYRTHAIGMQLEPTVQESDGRTEVVWELDNIEPRIDESLIPPENEVQMELRFAPTEFWIENYRGSCATWQLMGGWYSGLASDKYILSDEARKKINRMIDGEENDLDRIRKLYDFLQERTRYVAIELGVGRWQPYTAESVYKNQYGDCKDLTTLMISMLGEAGIEAFPALIKTRDDGVLIKDFPSNQFNHVIACVPMDEDTVWLECTSDRLAAGELPYMDEGCDVLVVGKDGGKIVRTPQSSAESNRWVGNLKASLAADGTLSFSGTVTTSGNQSNWLRGSLNDLKPEERQRWISRMIGRYVPKIKLADFQIDNLAENYHQPATLRYTGSVDRFGTRNRNRIFINPNLINRKRPDDILENERRHFPVYYHYSYQDVDSVVITIPGGYSLEAAPNLVDIDVPFGSYGVSYTFKDSTLSYCRSFKITQKQIPPYLYGDYLSFIKSVVNSDKSNFVFVKAPR